MKYTIEGFSQSIALGMGLDALDLMLLRWFVDFRDTGSMIPTIHQDQLYYWVQYHYIAEQMPLLGLQKQAIAKRFKKLASVGILTHYHGHDLKGKRGNFSFYGIGGRYHLLVSGSTNPVSPPGLLYEDTQPSIPGDRTLLYDGIEPFYTTVSNKDSSIKEIHLSENSYNAREENSEQFKTKQSPPSPVSPPPEAQVFSPPPAPPELDNILKRIERPVGVLLPGMIGDWKIALQYFQENGVEPSEVDRVHAWAMSDSFWADKAVKGTTFRKNYAQIKTKMSPPDKTTAAREEEQSRKFGCGVVQITAEVLAHTHPSLLTPEELALYRPDLVNQEGTHNV